MSGKTVDPRFLEFDDYLGAIGAFMQEFSQDENTDQK
jgi:pantothenate kinase